MTTNNNAYADHLADDHGLSAPAVADRLASADADAFAHHLADDHGFSAQAIDAYLA